jgi:predicted ATPase
MGTDHSQARFGELTVKGFRRLLDVKLALRPLSVTIGANGTGKTSVLDVLSLLAASAQGRLASTISELSGLASVLTYDRAEGLLFEISDSTTSDNPLEYSLRLRPQGLGYEIAEETLSRRAAQNGHPYIKSAGGDTFYFDPESKDPWRRPSWAYATMETSLAQVPKMLQEPEDFRRRLASSTSYHVLNVDPRSPVRLPQPMAPAELPGRNGEDLVSCLYNLRETDRDRFEAIQDSLRAAFPRFERLDFPPVAAGTLALAWRESGSSKPLYAHQLSEGTLRFLWLTTLLQSPGLTAVTLLDEPEVSLHPELLSLLADQLREASRRTQIVVATHSDALIRFLDPSEVVVMDSTEDGMTTLKRADELDLGEWLKDYSLDELWRNGRIGARA